VKLFGVWMMSIGILRFAGEDNLRSIIEEVMYST